MKLNLVPARTGAAWVRSGLKTFWQQPLAFISLFFLLMAVISTVSVLPLIGSIVAPVFLPFMTLGLMVATSVAYDDNADGLGRAGQLGDAQRPTGSAMFVAVFGAMRTEWRSLVVLGVISAIYFVFAVMVTALVDGGQLMRAYLLDDAITPEVMASSDFQLARVLLMCLNLPLSLAMWHAPALVHWHRVEPVKSIFFSIVALFRNFGAYALFVLAWFGVFLLAGIAMGLVATVLVGVGALGAGGAAVAVGNILMIGTALVLAAMSLSSTWFTFRDSFDPN
ncbi:BPSS1780 family membrane protein [Variovorax sp. ZS18.2.2]|uniref:BPSS1780 family membrane protein n=1 Tax=Variovorax sp. ZS18.2.2 TaxID=2971255 RepID=UPI002150C28A|nr:BPSS1780 family membrane protein [Variovorax sp. ZS18.2.2]MCR6474616.1 BPSS1780 family membrane protein [Variovorax sp. ZS18.2.2]